MVTSLNEMSAGPHACGEPGASATEGQLLVLDRLLSCAQEVGRPPPGLTGQEALRELLARRGYDGEPATLASLDVDRLALPERGHRAVPLSDLDGPAGVEVTRILQEKLLPKEEAEQRKLDSGVKKVVTDPRLRNRRRYCKLVKRLEACGLIEYRTHRVEDVGVFAIHKKGGMQRIIIDARWANSHFADPPDVKLATGQSFAMLEVDAGVPIWLGGFDIVNCFLYAGAA